MKKEKAMERGILVLDEKISQTFFKVILIDGVILIVIGLLMSWPLSLGFILLGLLTVLICELRIFIIGKRIKELRAS